MEKLKERLRIMYYIAAIVIAITAVITVYYAYIKPKPPFDTKIAFGGPVLREFDGQVSIALGIAASNVGGHSGCIIDMAMSVQSKASKTRWALMPTWFIDMKSFLRGLPEKQDVFTSVNGPFSPLSLPVNTRQNYGVFFMPRAVEEPKLKPLSCDDLIPGDNYEIKLYIITTEDDCKISKHNNWKLAAEAQFVMQKEHLTALNEGLAVIPLDEARDELRNNFLEFSMMDN